MKSVASCIVLPPAEPQQGPLCPCGNQLCTPTYDAYCHRSEFFIGRTAAGGASLHGGTPPDSSSLLAEWDRRAEATKAAIVAELRAREGTGSSTEDGTRPNGRKGSAAEKAASAPPGSSPAVKLPTKAVLNKRRAERMRRATSPHWLLIEEDRQNAELARIRQHESEDADDT